ncbi:unnamed protein product [Oikopleura dioica]|uniref:DLLregion-07 n=1 Tax=Oikopleura dioica TaxID=34765 RepID=Q6E7C5_OIKDI|nr:DLLregion-07 [Oikopleura dioica]CBY23741.1 unnamed protein product [Oikopleura dioica]CBY38193.1 unnamed protein product [Oikopleura dioica]
MAALRDLAGMSAQQYLLLRDQNPSVFGYNMQNEDYKLRKTGPDGKTNEKAIIIAMASTIPGSASIIWTEKRIPPKLTGNPVEDYVARKVVTDQKARMFLKYLWIIEPGAKNDPDRSDNYYPHLWRYLVVNSFHKNGVNIKRGAIVDKLFAFEIFEHIFEVFSPCAAKRVLGYFCRNGETSASAIQARMPITNKESA